MIHKGDLIEFTREHHRTYPPSNKTKVLYGVATKNEVLSNTNHWCCEVELADGSIELAQFIHAYAWVGWCPEELLATYEKHNREKWANQDGAIDYFEEGY